MLERVEMILNGIVPNEDVEITENTTLRADLAFNSFDLVSLASKMEEEFHIELDYSELIRIQTVGDILDCISN
jgi:acyl carrier protein